MKEGEIWKWTPSIAIGVSDPVTGTGGDYIGSTERIESGNGYFNRYYIIATKHFDTPWGLIGGHLGYQYSKRTDWNRKGVIVAVDWRPVWLQNRWFSPKFVFEYDSKNPNIGFIADIWDDRFEAMFCLQNFQWISFGLRFKLRLGLRIEDSYRRASFALFESHIDFHIMTYEQQALLHLVRLGIGNNAESGFDYAGVDWRNLVDSSFAQGVPAIAVDGLQRMYESNPLLELEIDRPKLESLKYEWFGSCFSAESDYVRHQSAIEEFLKLCKLQEVKALLLKGYGLSLNYPIPSHRPCGDIDIYLFGYAEFVSQLVEKHWKVSVDRSNPHHYVFSRNGVTFENHITLLDVERHRNHFSDEQVFQKLIAEGCDEIEVGGEKCFVPSVKLNSVYLLRHMAHHFAVEKITLRHILDWALFIKANASKIDWDFVYGYAEDSGCTPFLNYLNGICVESLGFAAEDFPVRERKGKLQARMLADILNPEFQEEIPDTSHKLRYGMAKTRRILANRWKYRMVSDERLVVTIWNLAKKRITK